MQPMKIMCTSAGKSQDSPNGRAALRSSLALAASSIREAINALRVDGIAQQALRQSAFRMLQAPEPLQEEPDALIANWGQLGDDKTDFGEGSLGLTGICPIAPWLSFVLPDKGDFILRIPVAEGAQAQVLESPMLDLVVDKP